MGTESRPNSDYTRTWSPSGEVEYATLADGTRLRYVKAGSGPALILLHTVRTQLDHFQLVIPKLVHAFTVSPSTCPAWGGLTSQRARATPSRRSAVRSSSSSRRLISTTSRWPANRWARRCRSRPRPNWKTACDASTRSTRTTTPEASVEPMASPRSTSAVHACRQSARWSRMPEREANLSLLPGARSISLPHTGHFAAVEQPARVAEILLDNHSA